MKPFVASIGLLVLVASACAMPARPGSEASAGPSRLQRILERGELRVGTSADLPPLNLRNKQGEVAGFEIDLVGALADAMKLELRFVVVPFGELLPTLERGDVDLVISGMTMTPQRNARVAFAGPYFISGTSLVSKSEQLVELPSRQVMNDPSRSYATLAESTSQRFVAEELPSAKLVVTSNYGDAVSKLLAGEVDAMVADYLACKLAVWQNADAGLHVMRTPFTTEPLGIALPADDPLLLNLVQNYLNTVEDTGELTMLKARWLSDGAWLDQLP